MSGLLWAVMLPAPAAASKKFEAIDRHALAAPKSSERSIPALAAYLVRPARTELEKARAIYRWVTHNIAYDADAFFSRRFRNARVTAEFVLNTRKGVCDGYSRIYEGLARAAGLEVARVIGYAKGFGYQLGHEIPRQCNHAWNAVQADGRWILLDSTWGAGAVSSESRSFVREFQEHYFQTKPEEMIYAHLPEDPEWQLLHKPVSREKFAGLPRLQPLFFQHKLKLQSHKDGEIKTGGQLKVWLEAPAEADLLARVMQNDRNLDGTLSYIERDRGRFTINALFPKGGDYTLRIFVRADKSMGAYGGAIDYLVRASKGTGERYPLYARPFFDHGLKLDSHKEGIIRADQKAEVSLIVPREVELTAGIYRKDTELDASLLYLHQEGGRYCIHTLYPRPGAYALRIFARPAGSKGVFHMALEYDVRVRIGTAERFPRYGPAFFDHGLKLQSHANVPIKTGDRLNLLVGAPSKIALIAEMLQDEKKVPRNKVLVQREGASYRVQALFPKRGAYTLRLFSNNKGGRGSYDLAIEYKVTAVRGAGPRAGYPLFHGRYAEQQAHLRSPMEGTLQAGTTQAFRIKVPGATHVAVVVGKDWTHLKKKGPEFQGEVPIGKGKINVFANFNGGKGSYAGLLEYTGR